MLNPGIGVDKSPTGFRHLGAINGNKAVRKYAGRQAVTGAFEHGRPEQAVEINNVFTNKMIQLGFRTGFFTPEIVKINIVLPIGKVFKAGHVAYGRIEPNIEKLVGFSRYFKTKIRRITAYVPSL